MTMLLHLDQVSKSFGKKTIFQDVTFSFGKVKTYITDHVTILVKGSRSMRMEKIVAGLLPATHSHHTEHSH